MCYFLLDYGCINIYKRKIAQSAGAVEYTDCISAER